MIALTFFFLSIEISKDISKYQPYLESYFQDHQIKKNNFFTDISNYLAYEIGQPTHCYDFNKINGPIEFDNTNVNEEFHTLLGNKIQLVQKIVYLLQIIKLSILQALWEALVRHAMQIQKKLS